MSTKEATPRVDPLLAMQVRLARPSRPRADPSRSARAFPRLTATLESPFSASSRVQADPKLAPFLRDDFDGTAYASGVLAGGPDAPKDAKKVLDRTIADLDAALALEVREHHDELLHQLGGIDEADRVLQIVKGGVASLRQTMGRVRDEIVEPHTAVDAKTRQLENLTTTVDLLRRVVRASKLNAKLRAALRVDTDDAEKPPSLEKKTDDDASTRLEAERRRRASAAAAGDLAKAAKTLGDIEELRREGAESGETGDAFAGVDALERDARWLAEAARETRRRAGAALDAGIKNASQPRWAPRCRCSTTWASSSRLRTRAWRARRRRRWRRCARRWTKALAREPAARARRGARPARPARPGARTCPPPARRSDGRRFCGRGWRVRWTPRARTAWRCGTCSASWRRSATPSRTRCSWTRSWARTRTRRREAMAIATRRSPTSMGHSTTTVLTVWTTVSMVWTDSMVSSPSMTGFPGSLCRIAAGSSRPRAPRARRAAASSSSSARARARLWRARTPARGSPRTRSAGYPRLVAALETLHARLARDSDAKGAPSASPETAARGRREDRRAVAQAYLGRAFQRLSEPVDALLSPSALQTLAQSVSMGGVASSSGSAGAGRGAADVRRFLARVRESSTRRRRRPAFSRRWRRAASRSDAAMARRAAAMATGAEARAFAIGQPATGAHRANAMLAASLEQVCAAMAEVLRDPALEERGGVGGSLGANARAARKIKASLLAATTALAETARDVASLVLDAAFERVSAHFAAMHDEDWAGGPPPGEHCSPYAARVAETLAWLREAHLKPLFPPLLKSDASSDTVSFLMASPTGEARRVFANRVFASFVRHACLLRPMGENGRLRLAKDTAELERAVDECAFPATFVGAIPKIAAATESANETVRSTTAFAEVSDGKSGKSKPPSAHDAVRALRGAVFLGLDELVADLESASRTPEPSSALGHLPAACVLMLAFSAAPASLQTPYQRAGLTPALYAAWMEKHAAEEVAAAADATLDAFEAKRGEKDAEAAAAAEKVRRAKRLLFP